MAESYLLMICGLMVGLFFASNLWVYLRVMRPLHHLSQQADLLKAGNLDAFEQPSRGIPEIEQLRRAMASMCGHVRRAQDQTRAYTDTLSDGLEAERQRIARELHDDTVQSVIAIIQGIDFAKHWVTTDSAQANQMLTHIREQAVTVVANLRDLIGGLRPPALEELGFVTALQMHIKDMKNPPAIAFSVEGTPRRLAENVELTLFRVAQEALTNVTRHSQAQQALITVTYQEDGVSLTVKDDGQGFVLPHPIHELASDNHYGLVGIQERVAGLGGTLTVISALHKGTSVTVDLPLKPIPQPDHLVRDPVCSAWIEPQSAYGSVDYEEETYYFCCPVCQGAFQKEPTAYIRNEQP